MQLGSICQELEKRAEVYILTMFNLREIIFHYEKEHKYLDHNVSSESFLPYEQNIIKLLKFPESLLFIKKKKAPF